MQQNQQDMVEEKTSKEDVLFQIEKACGINNQELIKHTLNSISSDEFKKRVFLKVIAYYEDKRLFPVGYYLLFIKWLIDKSDLVSATEHIMKCMQKGVKEDRISDIVYECLIKPNETAYQKTFNRNLHLLISCGVLFTGLEIDFDKAKQEITTIVSNYQEDFPDDLSDQEGNRVFMADVINTEIISQVLEKNNTIFLVFDDIKKFYYMLLFEDLSGLKEYIKGKKILFFMGREENLIKNFFENMLVLFPGYYCALSEKKKSITKIKALMKLRNDKIASSLETLKEYYRKLDEEYYRDLFSKDSSHVKIMLITSENTEINKFIVKDWCRVFQELGYQTRLLIENETYEQVNTGVIICEAAKYRPDIVFHINYTVRHVFPVDDICRNLLWIMRYRDLIQIPAYEGENMFISTMVRAWAEELIKDCMPEKRIMYSPEGVDINIFKKKKEAKRNYKCDIVSVNSSGGDAHFRFTYLIEMFNGNTMRQVIHELYSEITEMSSREQFCFFDSSFEKLLEKKLLQREIQINKEVKKIIARGVSNIMFAYYRQKVMEWIIDSGITTNIQLWGRSWSNYEKFRKYHMGIARHGKELSGIYGSSKISISDHPNIPLHERLFEIQASCGFPLVKHIQPENGEITDYITNYFKENEEIVLFYNKDDLLNKVQYYLDNPDERERIAENGKNVAMRDFSNVAVAKKTISFIKEYYVGQDVKTNIKET